MRKVKQFEVFGVVYENLQMPAVEAFGLIDYITLAEPEEMLRYCSVVKYDGSKVALNKKTIDKEVKDVLGYVPAKAVLSAIMQVVIDHNFGFLQEWKGAKIPSRFVSSGHTEKSTYMEPIIAQIVTANLVQYKDLETYYSLFDAFSMFDALLIKSLNEAYASEAAAKEAKNR
ncbi:hypothetical protein KYLE_52 [Pantoea phage Kyle]|uniref:Uncharacterized protein n=1 Tax=Pantoea phage Kyle TaxID=2589665 RepID=A0A514A8K3_9CAUD|nr:hypothetical protein HWC52_gp052 [Pantoea phage Kyle]QDH49608.1 hypothetical protein KYLE_52 [Pantoea phage Kyle]